MADNIITEKYYDINTMYELYNILEENKEKMEDNIYKCLVEKMGKIILNPKKVISIINNRILTDIEISMHKEMYPIFYKLNRIREEEYKKIDSYGNEYEKDNYKCLTADIKNDYKRGEGIIGEYRTKYKFHKCEYILRERDDEETETWKLTYYHKDYELIFLATFCEKEKNDKIIQLINEGNMNKVFEHIGLCVIDENNRFVSDKLCINKVRYCELEFLLGKYYD